MDVTYGILIGVIGSALVLFGAIGAYRDNFFSRDQLFARGVSCGLPYVEHYGMWSDLLLLTPALSAIVTRYASTWSVADVVFATFGSILVSLWLHYGLYIQNPIQTFLGDRYRLKLSGWVHLVYTALALSIFWLFYFSTYAVDDISLVTISAILVSHLIVCQLSKPVLNGDQRKQCRAYSMQQVAGWGAVIVLGLGIIWRAIVIY